MLGIQFLALGNESLSWVVYALGALTILYVVLRPSLRKKKDPLSKFPMFSPSQQRAVEQQMSDLLVELSKMARQITAQLDTRSAKLELLIQEADEKIARLQRLSAVSPAPLQPAEPDHDQVPPPSSPPLDPRHREVYTLADEGRTPQEIAQRLDRPQGEVELILALRRR